jgi:PAS domain-containing protein
VFDLDLRMRNGKTMPVRLYKLAFGADGAPGASRTLVINRARDDHSDPQRAAEVRFMRFFDHTPMAIATVDKTGNIVRANARFAKLTQSLSPAGRRANRSSRWCMSATVRDWSPPSTRLPTGRAIFRPSRRRWTAPRSAGAVLRHVGRT